MLVRKLPQQLYLVREERAAALAKKGGLILFVAVMCDRHRIPRTPVRFMCIQVGRCHHLVSMNHVHRCDRLLMLLDCVQRVRRECE